MIEQLEWPTGRAGRQTVLAQFGEARAELMRWALTTGDELADAVVTEMHEIGVKKARLLLRKGIREGSAALADPPPALAALLRQAESRPDYVDDQLLDQASMPFYTAPATVHLIALSAGALIRVYESPSISEVLTTTGRLVDGAQRRLQETGAWHRQVMIPGSLRAGQPGYVATLEVRMLHAHMRKLALDRGYDASVHGYPINQVDLGRTWMDFTLTGRTAEERLGFGSTNRETADLYRYWWYIAHLLGIDARLVEGITSNAAAQRIDDLFQTVTGPVTEDSAALADATLAAVASTMHEVLKVPSGLARPALNAITRRIHGDGLCRDLRIPASRVADVWLGPALSGLAAARERRRRDARLWDAMIDRNLAAARELLATPGHPTPYRHSAAGPDDRGISVAPRAAVGDPASPIE
ncbi:oxygenase MpaB family protein [Nocardia carnea]|uniref:oxygenase MpaB family protein n=1 Tax=Nocardia carnea TaxID=37328 RepID=UPI0024551885|nr:oxygenase MpaB family protein [Nocardia carnea]